MSSNVKEPKPPAFQSSLCRRIVKLSYLIGSISIVITAALFTTYLFAYPFRSNVCNGIDNGADNAAALCLSQQTDRGYIATSTLVKGKLLPAGFAKITNQAALDAGTATDGDYVLCEWNDEVGRCEEAEPDAPGCDSELNDDGTRKHRLGTDGECDALKVPELCKQTGFKSALTATAQEDLASAGANAEISAAILFITMILGIVSFGNYYWQPITSICGPDNMLSGLCSHYGKPFKLDIAYVVCGMWSSESCKHCAKKGQTGSDEAGKPAKFETDYEAATIWFSFLVHNVLILIFGLIGTNSKAAVDDECYGVKNADGELDIYGTGDAQDYIDALVDKDAKTYLDQRGAIYTAAQIFWWINLIAGGIQTGAYIMSNSGTADMDLVAVRDISDLNPFADIGINAQGKYSQLNQEDKDFNKENLYSRRTVQLRGQF